MTAIEGSLIVLAIGLLVGGLGIHVGARFALRRREYSHAVVTAALGAVAWGIVDYVFAELEAGGGSLSSLVGLLVWAWVLRRRYEVGWVRAGIIGVGAWIATLIALALLRAIGIDGLEAYGVPGT